MPIYRRAGVEAWISADFLRFWLGQSISMLGSQVTLLALPLTAVLLLDASPFEMGILVAAESAPNLLFGLFAGVWVDRHRRRPVLIAADVGRSVLLATIPLAAVLDRLGLFQLYAVALLSGALGSLNQAAYRPFVTGLVPSDKLLVANGRLEVSRSAALIGGPGIGGTVVQLLGPPLAIGLDALSFAISAMLLRSVRGEKNVPAASPERTGVRADILEGVTLIFRDPILRAITLTWTMGVFFFSISVSVFVLYMITDLGLSPATQGVVFALGGVGSLFGAVIANQVITRLGVGPTLIRVQILIGASGLLIPLAGEFPPATLPLLAAALFVRNANLMICDITWIGVIQTVTPQHLQGRVNATIGVFAFSLQPLGAILGGVLGDAVGLQPTLVLAAFFWSLLFLWPLCSPLRTMRGLPALRG
jgi:MFS family permease